MYNNNKRYSNDSACNTDEQVEIETRDDESIHSTRSTTSSMFSTSSRMSRIPNAVKSSLKQLVRRNGGGGETLSSKLKRHTSTSINFSHLLSRNNNKQDIIVPTSTASSTLFGYHNKQVEEKSKRRNSVVNLVPSRFLYKRNDSSGSITSNLNQLKVEQEEEEEEEEEDVGKLLFGKQVDDLEFFISEEQQSDSKSEKVFQTKKEEPWIRQRAKSCQVTGYI
jgi:hypothetical protein